MLSKQISIISSFLFITLLSTNCFAELIKTVDLSLSSSSYSTGATADPERYAWTYETGAGDGHDIWTFDMTAFDPDFYLSTTLILGDYCCHADIHRLYWDGVSIGDTGVGTPRTWEFDALATTHTLEVEWLNPISGGAWYNIGISVDTGRAVESVPEPSTLSLLALALVGIGATRRRLSS